jgi:hypothetical protein
MGRIRLLENWPWASWGGFPLTENPLYRALLRRLDESTFRVIRRYKLMAPVLAYPENRKQR